ncbi:MAG: hypothetical protein E6J21_15050 [Chloroflexota bacterium]|nr:MAG: hypothetical protein E6J21_15050 [Chloroflexota bacterium]
MQVSSQRAPARRWAQNLYLVLASLVLLGIFLQGFLIGAFLFGGAVWGRDAHSLLGLVLLVLSLLLALAGLLAQVSGPMKIWGFLLFSRAAPGQRDAIVWPEFVPDLSDPAGDGCEPTTEFGRRTSLKTNLPALFAPVANPTLNRSSPCIDIDT